MIALIEVAQFAGRSEPIADCTNASDRERLREAFRIWRRLTGGRARGPFACCGSCGHYELSSMDEADRPYVFWHSQSEQAFSGDVLAEQLHLYHHFTDPEQGELLVAILSAVGLESTWCGSHLKAVRVTAQDEF